MTTDGLWATTAPLLGSSPADGLHRFPLHGGPERNRHVDSRLAGPGLTSPDGRDRLGVAITVRKCLAAAAALLVILSCGAVHRGSNASTDDLRVATYSSQFMMQARLTGQLRGQANGDGTACFWVDHQSDGILLIWPHGFVARQNPLRVVGDRGSISLAVGQRITIGGGYAPSSLAASVTGCHGRPLHAWLAAPTTERLTS